MTRPDFQHGLRGGIDRFNRLEFWEAHEAWEELWLQAQSDVHQFPRDSFIRSRRRIHQ